MADTRDVAILWAHAAAKKQFDGSKGHGGSERVVHRQISEQQMAALLAAAFETGAEFGATRRLPGAGA